MTKKSGNNGNNGKRAIIGGWRLLLGVGGLGFLMLGLLARRRLAV